MRGWRDQDGSLTPLSIPPACIPLRTADFLRSARRGGPFPFDPVRGPPHHSRLQPTLLHSEEPVRFPSADHPGANQQTVAEAAPASATPHFGRTRQPASAPPAQSASGIGATPMSPDLSIECHRGRAATDHRLRARLWREPQIDGVVAKALPTSPIQTARDVRAAIPERFASPP